MIGSGGKKLAVECDGKQHELEENKEYDIRREDEIKSFSNFYRIKQSDFYSQPDQVLEDLWMKMEEIGIKPFAKSEGNKSFRGQPFRRFKK